VIITEWDEFRALDLGRVKQLMRRPLMVDLRNIYQPEEVRPRGFTYISVGRASVVPASAGSASQEAGAQAPKPPNPVVPPSHASLLADPSAVA
jgi:hypothetical protein